MEFCFASQAEGQPDDGTGNANQVVNIVYLELLGSAGSYTLNYERVVAKYFAGRLGLSYIPPLGELKEALNMDVDSRDCNHHFFTTMGISLLLGTFADDRAKVEVGLGLTIRSRDRDIGDILMADGEWSAWLAGGLGLRYQPLNGGIVFRATYTPILVAGLPHWGGVSFGYAF